MTDESWGWFIVRMVFIMALIYYARWYLTALALGVGGLAVWASG